MTNQTVSIVSPVEGTTTDPVQKAMELLPLGPVVLFDTPGLDDETELGKARVDRAMDILRKTDIVVLVANAAHAPAKQDETLLNTAKEAGRPAVIALNKTDLPHPHMAVWETLAETHGAALIKVSALTGEGVQAFKEHLAALKPQLQARPLISDLVGAHELCVLVVPVDSAAPKGRLILPQQQVIRDLLDHGAYALVTKDTEYPEALSRLQQQPALVVTDSQVFGFVSEHTPASVKLTSFSILFARYKGEIDTLIAGARAVEALQQGDAVLVCEGCTHHRQCDDIGTVKIPQWMQAYTGKELDFTFTSGKGFPKDLSGFKLIVHCGGCMLNEREMKARLLMAQQAGIPIVNYGVLIAHMNGILQRSVAPLGIRLSDAASDA
jgi:[FeFe] hydrogenase H-cluster maturation GTPase HydF